MKQALIGYWRKFGIVNDKLALRAFAEVDRKRFITEANKEFAYEDIALPLISGQTISQPTTVMLMTGALEVKRGMKVLEVGTGSGYQAAILSNIVGSKGQVITTEIVPELIKFAKGNLKGENIKNVKVVKCDGSKGYTKEAPYDRIIVTAASPFIPKPLIGQLKTGGILVIPVGGLETQSMMKVKKLKGRLEQSNLGLFRFVPLKGAHGHKVL